jgi:hypothetical protein
MLKKYELNLNFRDGYTIKDNFSSLNPMLLLLLL